MIIESLERAKYMMLMDESRKLLFKKLKKIWDDTDFIVGVLSDITTEENCQLILEYIDNGIEVTPPNLVMLCLDLKNGGKEYYDKYWKLDDEQRNNKE